MTVSGRPEAVPWLRETNGRNPGHDGHSAFADSGWPPLSGFHHPQRRMSTDPEQPPKGRDCKRADDVCRPHFRLTRLLFQEWGDDTLQALGRPDGRFVVPSVI